MQHGGTEARRFWGLSEKIIGGCIEVHRTLGPGLLESAYERCLAHELWLRGLRVERQQKLPVSYKGLRLDFGYRLDLVVEDSIVVETKAVESIQPVHEAQVITYLRLSGYAVGLLVNFHCDVIRNGIHRFVLTDRRSTSPRD
jgi:GxxExxY protein